VPEIADDIPLMIGGTKEESTFFLADDDAVWNGAVTEEDLRERVAAVAGTETNKLLDAYPPGDAAVEPRRPIDHRAH
jgi:para-nitrobenzyl esterase